MIASTTKTELANYFNSNVLELSRHIAKICPNSIIGNNMRYIDSVLHDKSHIYWSINLFVIKVLPYKEAIDRNDESFFLMKEYSKDFEGYDSYINKIFEFRDIWGQLSTHNKKMVFMYLQALCAIALSYFAISQC